MIKSVYSAVKTINKSVTFGISPASDMDYDYSTLYADVIKWSRNEGYIDYICPQIYFGFKNENQPFMQTTKGGATMPRAHYILHFLCISQDLLTNTQGRAAKTNLKKKKI